MPIAVPRHSQTRRLLGFWDERPKDGLHIGRDVPSQALAPLLTHLIVWQPVADGADFTIRVIGEALRARCGGFDPGRRMSELLSPELFAYHLDTDRRTLSRDRCAILDVVHSHNGSQYLHFEMLLCAAHHPATDARWMVAGIFHL